MKEDDNGHGNMGPLKGCLSLTPETPLEFNPSHFTPEGAIAFRSIAEAWKELTLTLTALKHAGNDHRTRGLIIEFRQKIPTIAAQLDAKMEQSLNGVSGNGNGNGHEKKADVSKKGVIY